MSDMERQIREQVEARVKDARAALAAADKKEAAGKKARGAGGSGGGSGGRGGAGGSGSGGSGGQGPEIDSDFIMACLNRNELGDGELFKALYRNDFVFNKAMDSWMQWAGHHWVVDRMDNAMASVDGVAKVYEDEGRRISAKIKELAANGDDVAHLEHRRKRINDRVAALRSSRRRKNCLLFAHTSDQPLAIDGVEIDQQPWLLPCANGVVNLKTGELEQGRQKDYLLKACPVAWPADGIDATSELWEKTLLEIFSDNRILVDFFRRLCGYAMIGEVLESIFIVMLGQGRNGKSMVIETIARVLGPLSGAIRSEMLLDQFRVSNSSGPTPDLMTLRGLRMAFASETDDGCKISMARVKWLTGSDTINARNPNDKYEVEFRPSHTLFLLTNHKPRANADDFAFWERMLVIPFELSFVNRPPARDNERQGDPYLNHKLEKELPQILAWMVRGCLEWQQIGLDPPAAVKQAIHDYKKDEDLIGGFIDECCVVGEEYSASAGALYARFEEWWTKNISNRVPKQKPFGTMLKKKFTHVKSGTVKYLGVGLIDDENDRMPF